MSTDPQPDQEAGLLALQKYAETRQAMAPRDIEPTWNLVSRRLMELKAPATDLEVRKNTENEAEKVVSSGHLLQVASRKEGASSGRSLRRWVGYSITACCVFAISWWTLSSNRTDNSINTYTTYSTKAGQRASITLKDGSQVTLGPITTLRVQKQSSQGEEVKVEVAGEAFFRVNHSKVRLFSVAAQGVVTQVLGTEFVVRAYDASLVRVAVREGRVSVQSPLITTTNTAIISAGEAASVSQSTSPVISSIDDLATDFAWANGELVLRNVTLGEALTRLSRWYGMEFKVSDPSLLNGRINTVFPAEFRITKLEDVALAINARVSQSGGTFTFSRIK